MTAFTPRELDAIRWVERNRNGGKPLSDGQARCALTLCSIAAPYNLQAHDRWRIDPWGIRVRYFGDIATFDFDEVTRLVVAAHEHCVRVQFSPGKTVKPLPRYCLDGSDRYLDDDRRGGPTFNITTHWRDVGATSGYRRHPTLGDLAERARALDADTRWLRLGATWDEDLRQWRWPGGEFVMLYELGPDALVAWKENDRMFDSEDEAYGFVLGCHLAAAREVTGAPL